MEEDGEINPLFADYLRARWEQIDLKIQGAAD
jgi:hypothetical protein